jgi:hypothetical protein
MMRGREQMKEKEKIEMPGLPYLQAAERMETREIFAQGPVLGRQDAQEVAG